MRKLPLLLTASFLLSGIALAYTSADLETATYLANQGIINKQSIATNYRLDANVSRYEVMIVALRIKGIDLTQAHTCKKYYSDVVINDQKCKVVELAADNGIITRSNAKARPSDNVTRVEALKILMSSGGIPLNIVAETEGVLFDTSIRWQLEMLNAAHWEGIIDITKMAYIEIGNPEIMISRQYKFYPNRAATRAEVFGFARNIFGLNGEENITFEIKQNDDDNSPDQPNILYVKKESSNIEVDRGYITNAQIIGHFLIYDWSLTGGTQKRIFDTQSLSRVDAVVPWGKLNDEKTYIYGCDPLDWSYCGIFSLEKGRTVYVYQSINDGGGIIDIKHTGGAMFQITEGSKVIDIDASKNVTTVKGILSEYYALINIGNDTGSFESAYSMRSPAGVSLATFSSWYANVTNVNFREDTLVDLGNNTYEFRVELTENGVVNTYKVKSKVDVENFTIESISSVKI